MQSFEQIRSHAGSRHTLRTNDPYLISFDLELAREPSSGHVSGRDGGRGRREIPAHLDADRTVRGPRRRALHALQLGAAARLSCDQRSRWLSVPASVREPAVRVPQRGRARSRHRRAWLARRSHGSREFRAAAIRSNDGGPRPTLSDSIHPIRFNRVGLGPPSLTRGRSGATPSQAPTRARPRSAASGSTPRPFARRSPT